MVSKTAPVLALASTSLCRSCSHARDCAHRQRHDGVVLQCEDFDDTPIAGASEPLITVLQPPRPAPSPGLCSNCLNREHCALPGARYGTWHCEEYA